MSKLLVPDDLWTAVEPLLPPARPRPKGGRPPVSDRAALTGILFVLRTGLSWEYLPAETGCGSGMTCWRRLRDWQQAGVWAAPRWALLEHLEAADSWTGAKLRWTVLPSQRKKTEPRPVQTRRIALRTPQ